MLGETAPDPIRLLTISRRGKTISRQFVVMIERRLLSKQIGEWVVPTLLRVIRSSTKDGTSLSELREGDPWVARLYAALGSLAPQRLSLTSIFVPADRTPAIPDIEQTPSEASENELPTARTPRASRVESAKDLKLLWTKLVEEYFPSQPDLLDYRVVWSYRDHSSTLASCQAVKRIVRVAAVMQNFEAAPFLEALVYHELCHAVLGPIERVNGRRVVHGREFKALEKRHPGIPELNAWIAQGGWRRLVLSERRKAKRSKR